MAAAVAAVAVAITISIRQAARAKEGKAAVVQVLATSQIKWLIPGLMVLTDSAAAAVAVAGSPLLPVTAERAVTGLSSSDARSGREDWPYLCGKAKMFKVVKNALGNGAVPAACEGRVIVWQVK